MKFDLSDIINAASLQLGGYAYQVQLDALIAQFLGDDARHAHLAYKTKLAALKKPSSSDFGLSHAQLRGVKYADKLPRLVEFDAAKQVYNAQLSDLNQQYHTLLSNIILLQNSLSQFKKCLNDLQDNFNETLEAAPTQYALHQGTERPLAFNELPEKQWYDHHRHVCSSVNINDLYQWLLNLGFLKEKLTLIHASYDEYGHETAIRVRGLAFDFVLTQNFTDDDRNIVCHIECNRVDESSARPFFVLIGGKQSITIRKNYSDALIDWIAKNRYVLTINPQDSDYVLSDIQLLDITK